MYLSNGIHIITVTTIRIAELLIYYHVKLIRLLI